MATNDVVGAVSGAGALRLSMLTGLGTPVLAVPHSCHDDFAPAGLLMLDLLFTFNIALAMIVLLASVYSSRPLDFAAFPSILLIATLLRLSLNVASTRVVLLEGHNGTGAAGKVIQAFGEFVIGGSYTVGIVVFAILVIINFVVVTKGAGRISEVTARFTWTPCPASRWRSMPTSMPGLSTRMKPGKGVAMSPGKPISMAPWTAPASSFAAMQWPGIPFFLST